MLEEIIGMLSEIVSEILPEILQGPTYLIGNAIWSITMRLIGSILTMTPQAFSSEAWAFTRQLYRWSLGIGILLMNLFFLIGFFRQASNLRENITWEILFELLIKAIMANALMRSGMEIIREFYDVAALLSRDIYIPNMPEFSTENLDSGSYLFFFIFGLIYVLVAVVCSFVILLTVYGRYLKLYVLAVFAPVALSTWAGGRGLERTAYSWIRTFLANVFEIVVIALVMTLAGKMISSIDFGTFPTGILTLGDGFLSAVQSMFTMVIMAAAVKGAQSQLQKAFGL